MTHHDPERLYRLAIDGDIEASRAWIRDHIRRGGTPQPEGEMCGPYAGKAKLIDYEGRRKQWRDITKRSCWGLHLMCVAPTPHHLRRTFNYPPDPAYAQPPCKFGPSDRCRVSVFDELVEWMTDPLNVLNGPLT